MDAQTRKKIVSHAWDATVGAGITDEDRGPSARELARLAQVLGHSLTAEDERVFRSAWARYMQEANQV